MAIATAICLAILGVGQVIGQAAQFTMTSNGQLIDNTVAGPAVGARTQPSLMANPLTAYLMQLQQQLHAPMQTQMVQQPQLLQPSPLAPTIPQQQQQLQQLQQQIQQHQQPIMVPSMQNINQNFFRAQSTVAQNFGLSAMAKQELLDSINNLRAEVEATRMYALRWNNTLAALAFQDVQSCTYTDKGNGAILVMVEDLHTGVDAITEAVTRWSNEKTNFELEMACKQRRTCRYTRLVWADSMEVGCAKTPCIDMNFIACMFYPPANNLGMAPYEFGTQCSGCPSSCTPLSLCNWY